MYFKSEHGLSQLSPLDFFTLSRGENAYTLDSRTYFRADILSDANAKLLTKRPDKQSPPHPTTPTLLTLGPLKAADLPVISAIDTKELDFKINRKKGRGVYINSSFTWSCTSLGHEVCPEILHALERNTFNNGVSRQNSVNLNLRKGVCGVNVGPSFIS